jgi:hypothetical protein
MKVPSNLGMILLGIWLVIMGTVQLLSISLGGLSIPRAHLGNRRWDFDPAGPMSS